MTESRPSHERIAGLDGFRGMAALMVVLFHFQTDVFVSGEVGVDLFFVLSGFLITGLLLAEHRRLGRIDLPRFYARRALRLYPALILAVGLTVVIQTRAGAALGDIAGFAAQALTYTTNLFVGFGGEPGPLNITWSLGVEEQFYLIWAPVLALALVRWAPLRIAVLAYLLALSAHFCTALLLSEEAAFYLPTSRFDETLAGGILAAALVAPGLRAKIARLTEAGPAVASLAVLLLLVFVPMSGGMAAFGRSVVVTFAAVVLIAHLAVHSTGYLSRIFGCRAARWLGERSYSLYLVHLLVFGEWAQRVEMRPLLSIPLALAAALVVAHLSYVCVERPFLKLKPYAKGRRVGPAPPQLRIEGQHRPLPSPRAVVHGAGAEKVQPEAGGTARGGSGASVMSRAARSMTRSLR